MTVLQKAADGVWAHQAEGKAWPGPNPPERPERGPQAGQALVHTEEREGSTQGWGHRAESLSPPHTKSSFFLNGKRLRIIPHG